jgi:fucose permease
MIMVSSLLAGVAAGLLAASPDAPLSFLWIAASGFFCAPIFPLLIAVSAERYFNPRSKSTVSAIAGMFLTANIGGAVLPTLQGLIVDGVAVRESMLASSVCSVVVIALMSYFVVGHLERSPLGGDAAISLNAHV